MLGPPKEIWLHFRENLTPVQKGIQMLGLMAAALIFAQGATDTPASPATAPKAPVGAKSEEQAKLDKVVCHEEAVVGSRFPRKVCQSKRAEAVKRQEDQETVRHMQDMTAAPISR